MSGYIVQNSILHANLIQETILSLIKTDATDYKEICFNYNGENETHMLDCKQAQDSSLLLTVHDCPGSLKKSQHMIHDELCSIK